MDVALRWAIIVGDTEHVRRLLAQGADPNCANGAGLSQLHYASMGKASPDITQLLVEAGADVNARDMNGITPLFHSAEIDDYDKCNLLLKAGADPNVPHDPTGQTALHRLADNLASPHTIGTFMYFGADPQATDAQGKRPSDLAWSRSPEHATTLALESYEDQHELFDRVTKAMLVCNTANRGDGDVVARGHQKSNTQEVISEIGAAFAEYEARNGTYMPPSHHRESLLHAAIRTENVEVLRAIAGLPNAVFMLGHRDQSGKTPFEYAEARGFAAGAAVISELYDRRDRAIESYNESREAARKAKAELTPQIVEGIKAEAELKAQRDSETPTQKAARLSAELSREHEAIQKAVMEADGTVSPETEARILKSTEKLAGMLRAYAAMETMPPDMKHLYLKQAEELEGQAVKAAAKEQQEGARAAIDQAIADNKAAAKEQMEGAKSAIDQARLDDALINSAFLGDIDGVRDLLRKGANPNATRADGNTPAHCAATNAEVGTSAEIIGMLHVAGANLDTPNNAGYTVAHMAASSDNGEAVMALSEAGANLNAVGPDGKTPLAIAAKEGCRSSKEALIDEGALVRPTKQVDIDGKEVQENGMASMADGL